MQLLNRLKQLMHNDLPNAISRIALTTGSAPALSHPHDAGQIVCDRPE